MSRDLSKPYRQVGHFGIWASETALDYGNRDAAAILVAAVKRCRDEDMRLDGDVRDALAYLARNGHDKRTAQFSRALEIMDPMARRQATAKAVNALIVTLGEAGQSIF